MRIEFLEDIALSALGEEVLATRQKRDNKNLPFPEQESDMVLTVVVFVS